MIICLEFIFNLDYDKQVIANQKKTFLFKSGNTI